MDKRAISPLFATFILLIFAIVAGIIVMSWGRAYVETRVVFHDEGFYLKEQCRIDTSVESVSVSRKDIDYSRNGDFLDVSMNYDVDLQGKGFKLVVEGERGMDTIPLDNFSLRLSSPKSFRIEYNPTIGEIKEIRIVD